MTTFDQRTASSAADATLDRLRSGAPLTPAQRDGLAELLLKVKAGSTIADRPGHDSPEARSGLWRNVHAAYQREFGQPETFPRGTEIVVDSDSGPIPVVVIQHHNDGWIEVCAPGSDVGFTVHERTVTRR